MNIWKRIFMPVEHDQYVEHFKQQVADLNTTIESVSIQITDAHKKAEKVLKIMEGFEMGVKDKPWWNNNEFLMNCPDMDTHILATRIQKEAKIKWVEKNKSLKVHNIFHGGCIGCKTPLNTNLGTCLGCQYLTTNWNDPNLSTK